MQKIPTLFLKIVLFCLALIALGVCVLVFQFSSEEIPDTFPAITSSFLQLAAVGVYLSTIPFFFAAYNAFLLLQNVDKSAAFSQSSIVALKMISYSTIGMSACYFLAMPFIYIIAEFDDAPGLILLGMAFCSFPFVFAMFATVFQKLFQSAFDMKTENDLTV